MKSYPSIPRDFSAFEAYVFDKLDGSNLRFEWARKQGWYKHGTRTRLFDETDPVFGCAISLFQETWAKSLHDIAVDNRYERLVCFFEFYGASSFAGLHDPSEPKKLTLFDVAPYKKGILPPKDFLKLFGHLDVPKFLGRMNWTRQFVEDVWQGKVDGVTFEGVIGKAVVKNQIFMRKAKTKVWVDKVKSCYTAEDAEKIINS